MKYASTASATVSCTLLSLLHSTTTTMPLTMSSSPTQSILRNGSLRNSEANTALNTTPTAPTGVTTDAGAKPSASRLPSSPSAFNSMPTHHSGSFVYGRFCAQP